MSADTKRGGVHIRQWGHIQLAIFYKLTCPVTLQQMVQLVVQYEVGLFY
jgi:hypothetical protein